MESPLENELILENIFRYLSTSDLLHRVNLTNTKWKQVSDQFVQQKRQISLNNSNILAYINMIKGGRVPHKFIKLRLDNSSKYNVARILDKEDRIISCLDKFQDNIQHLELQSSKWENTCLAALDPLSKETEAELFAQILHGALKVESLSLKIKIAPYGIHEYEIPTLLQLSDLGPRPNLKSLEVGVENGKSHLTDIILGILSSAPNIEKLHLASDLSLEGFAKIDAKYPGLIYKIESLAYENFTDEIGKFLLSQNFASLKKLELYLDVDLQLYRRVLEKYKDQLIYLMVDLHVVIEVGDWVQPVINLPLMKKLETLKLVNSCVVMNIPRSVNCRFWNISGAENLYPNLKNIIVEFEDQMANFNKEFDPLPKEILEQILTQTFPDIPNHPIFPGVKNIDLDGIRGLENYMFAMKPELCATMRRYCPNLLCRSVGETLNFVSTGNTNFRLRE